MIKFILCLFVALVLGGLTSAFWWAFDDEVPMKLLMLPPYAVFGILWFVLPEESEGRAPRRF